MGAALRLGLIWPADLESPSIGCNKVRVWATFSQPLTSRNRGGRRTEDLSLLRCGQGALGPFFIVRCVCVCVCAGKAVPGR